MRMNKTYLKQSSNTQNDVAQILTNISSTSMINVYTMMMSTDSAYRKKTVDLVHEDERKNASVANYSSGVKSASMSDKKLERPKENFKQTVSDHVKADLN